MRRVFRTALFVLGMAIAEANAVELDFTYQGLITCRQPSVTNYDMRGGGIVVVNQDGSSTYDYRNSAGVQTRVIGKLGGSAVQAEGGSIRIGVQSGNRVRIVRDYPNNREVIEIRFVGKTCQLTTTDHLKPGKSEYTFIGPTGFSYCSKPTITKTTCVAR
jgi:hypothetical protein